jgi:hypothetical protein
LITGLLFSDKSLSMQFQTRTQQSAASEAINAPPTGMTFISLSLKDEHWHSFLIWHFVEEAMEDQLVDVPVFQHASPPRAEPSAQVEILSSSGTQSPPAQTETPTSPEVDFPIQPEPSIPSRAQSPIGQAETSTLAEVNPFPLQPEALELPETASAPSHTEASASPGTSPSPVIPGVAPEQNPALVQKVRHEVNICT